MIFRSYDEYPERPFFALIDKLNGEAANEWIVFPWEVSNDGTDESATDIVTRLLQFVGDSSLCHLPWPQLLT